jgi:hypothetical protein
LQLGRALPALLALVRAAHVGDELGVRRAGLALANALLLGARDRSRERRQRSVLDQQRRHEPLRSVRR